MINKAIWDRLSNSTSDSTRIAALRLYPDSKFNLFAALDNSNGRRIILLRSDALKARPELPLPSGRGFKVRLQIASEAEGSKLQFELLDPSFADIFNIVSNDVLQNVLKSDDENKAFITFISKITEWQYFLDQLPTNGLSEMAQQGLFAELWFLRNYLFKYLDPLKALNAWAGPEKLSKDFQCGDIAFEVKSSSMKQHTKFSISNEMQLDCKGYKILLLFCLFLEKRISGGITLPEIISQIKGDLIDNPNASAHFSELLLKCGYAESDAELYTINYFARSEKFFNVSTDFPRIIASDLRQGVGDIQYSIQAAACEPYVVSEKEILKILQTLAV